MIADQDDIPQEELSERVIYALLTPAVRLARRFDVPLTRMKEWVEVAYFHELKREDMKQREMAQVLGVSVSKVALLARQLKANFMRPEIEQALPRRVEFMLWAEPLSLAKLSQVLTDVSSEAIAQALEQLVAQGRVREEQGAHALHYALQIDMSRRVWESWLARIDGLQNALETVTGAVAGRFFDDAPLSFARTLSFRLLPEELPELRALYEQTILAKIIELDARAVARGEGAPMAMSLFWSSPDDALRAAPPAAQRAAEPPPPDEGGAP